MKNTIRRIALALTLAAATAHVPANAAGNSMTLLETALAANATGSPFEGRFDTLIAAVLAADPAIGATLSAKGQRTVFAPTDEAFAALGLDSSNIGTLPQSALTQILAYHVAQGRRDSGSVTGSTRIRMLFGGFVYVSGTVLTDAVGRQANIIVTDIAASNGIIHVIDQVILPYVP